VIAAPDAPAASPSHDRLKATRGEAYPAPGAGKRLVVDYIKRLLQDGDADALARYKRASHNLLFADGRQWIDWNLRDKSWKDAPAPEGRVRVTMNYVRPILRARIQRLLSSQMSWQAIPNSNAHEDRDKATVAANVLESRWNRTDMVSKIRQAEWLAFSCGVAYLKPFWNPDLGQMVSAKVVMPHPFAADEMGQPVPVEYAVDPQGQPLMDEQGNPLPEDGTAFRYRQGDTDTAVRTIFNVRVNSDAFGLNPSEGFRWLIDSEVVPISVVKERYGDAAKEVKSVEGVAQLKQFEGLIKSVGQRADSRSGGGDLHGGRGGKELPDKELTLLMEYWEAPSESLPEGRLVVIGGEELLYDDVLPQGTVPHIPVYDERRAFDAYGHPTVDDLIQPQKVINKQWSLALEEQALNGVGQWIGFDVPGMFDQITNLSAAHIKVPMNSMAVNKSIGELVQRVPPAQVSPDRWRLIEKAEQVMYTIGAFHDVARGQIPGADTSGVAIQLLQEAQAGQLEDAVSALKASLILWGRHTLSIARWGYGEHEERWIPVERPDLGFLVESETGADLPDPETMDIDLDGFRPTSKAAFDAQIGEAIDKQWIPVREGLQMMDLGRGIEGAFESESRHYARARRENLAIERGEVQPTEHPEGSPLAGSIALIHPKDGSPFLLPSNDEHEIHIRLHEEILLDDTKPWPTRQMVALHIAEHQQVLAQQAQAAAEAEIDMKQRSTAT